MSGLLGDIILTEEQEKELVSKIDSLVSMKIEDIKKDYETKIATLKESSSKITEDGKDLILSDDEQEVLQEKLVEWKEKIEDELESSLQSDYSSKLTEEVNKIKADASKRVISIVKDLYEEIEDSVREKLLESDEFQMLSKVKEVVAPAFVEGEYTNSVMNDVKELKKVIKEQAEYIINFKKKSKLEQLTATLPESIKPHFVSILSEAKDEDQMVEIFQQNIKLLKDVKTTLTNELEQKNKTKLANISESASNVPEEKPVQVAPIKNPEVKKEKVLTEEQKVSVPAAPKKSIRESLKTESDVDYDILTEDFKRVEIKTDALGRLKALAGLE